MISDGESISSLYRILCLTTFEPIHRQYSGCDWYEIEDEFELDKQREINSRTETIRSKANYQAKVDNLLEEVEAVNTNSLSKSEHLHGIRENRAEERELEQQKRRNESNSEEAPHSEYDVRQSADETYVPARKLTGILRRK